MTSPLRRNRPAPRTAAPSVSIIPIKTEAEIESMRAAGQVAATALRRAEEAVAPGVTTARLDELVRETLALHHADVLFEGYRQGHSPPFPAACCISVNEEVVHGIPGDRVLREGDLVTIDVGLRLRGPGDREGWCADAAISVLVGGDAPTDGRFERADAQQLIESTRRALREAIGMMSPGVRWSEVAGRLQQVADEAGLGVVEEYVGHGVGRRLHEPPQAPTCVGGPGFQDFTLRPGMVLAVEPILTLSAPRQAGKTLVRLLDDGWTVVTQNRSLACHVEHTVAVREDGADVLTALN